MTVQDHLALLRAADSERPALVIWQAGTVEATRGMDPDEMTEALQIGLESIRRHGADAVLIEPQFSRFLQTNTNLDPYAQAFQQVAAMPGVALFRRYDLMRAWVNEGRIDLERAPRADRQRTIEALHRCLGLHLARLILGAGRS